MRNFYLENAAGERLALSDPGKLWFNQVGGLGTSSARSFATVKPGFFVATDEKQAQTDISGTLIFRQENTYKAFQEVTDWIYRAAGLKFVYEPYQGCVYYKDVEINSFSKSEMRMRRWLECDTTFRELTPWYSIYSHRFNFDIDEDNSYKRYGYRYPYRYAAAFAPGSLDFRIEGHYPGEIELIAQGPLSSPVLTLCNTHTEELYGRLDLSAAAVGDNQMLYYSTRATNPGVWIVQGAERTDVIDMVELAAGVDSFFTVPPNTPVTVTISVEGKINVAATLNVLQYYRLR